MPRARTRVDDATAHLDSILAHGTLAISLAVAIVALTVPTMRGALVGSLVVGALCAFRLIRHPLRGASLSRVYVEEDRVLIAPPLLGKARPVQIAEVAHERHSPWPCTLVLEDGQRISFVARRDDGSMAFFDLELSDRARYERPSDARDSLTSVEMAVRTSRPPRSPDAQSVY
jgi:hypothetical protein